MSDKDALSWIEPDEGLLNALTRVGTLAADHAVAAERRAIAIPVERDRAAIRGALRCLLANGMITATPMETWPEWKLIDPPGE